MQTGDVGVSVVVGFKCHDADENGNKKERGTIILVRVNLTLTRGGLVDTLPFGCEVLPARARAQGGIENGWLGRPRTPKTAKDEGTMGGGSLVAAYLHAAWSTKSRTAHPRRSRAERHVEHSFACRAVDGQTHGERSWFPLHFQDPPSD